MSRRRVPAGATTTAVRTGRTAGEGSVQEGVHVVEGWSRWTSFLTGPRVRVAAAGPALSRMRCDDGRDQCEDWNTMIRQFE
eukprot:1374807-Pyramimonas_sp.AAC.2